MSRGLQLDLSMGGKDGYDLDSTYRNEGLSVGADHMRLFGEEVKLEVQYSDLILGSKIGQGACSSVNLAQHRVTKEVYAIKMFNIYDHAQASQLFNEILLLTSFQCDALISLKGAFHDQGCIGVILEYMDRGSLEFIMDKDIPMTEEVMAAISFQVIWGLGYLHYEKQIHRDIKPGNMLMNSRGEVKLSDFGISKELDHTTAMSSSAVGSYRYMSPERLLGEKYDASADVWSVGVTIVQLWNKKYPFEHCAETPIHLSGELQRFQLEKILPRTAGVSNSMREFLKKTLAVDPNDRASCMELSQTLWFEACGIASLPEAHSMVARWIKEVDKVRKWKKATPSAKLGSSVSMDTSSSIRGGQFRPPNRQADKIVRDICEMSISLDASQSKWDFNELSMSRSNNPFTSSANLGASMGSTATAGFGQNNASRSGVPVQQSGHHYPNSFAPPAASASHGHQNYPSHQIRPTNHGMQQAPMYSNHHSSNNNSHAHHRPLAATKPSYNSRSEDDYDQDPFEDEETEPYHHDQEFKMAENRNYGSNQRHDAKSSRK